MCSPTQTSSPLTTVPSKASEARAARSRRSTTARPRTTSIPSPISSAPSRTVAALRQVSVSTRSCDQVGDAPALASRVARADVDRALLGCRSGSGPRVAHRSARAARVAKVIPLCGGQRRQLHCGPPRQQGPATRNGRTASAPLTFVTRATSLYALPVALRCWMLGSEGPASATMKRAKEAFSSTAANTKAAPARVSIRAIYSDAMRDVMADPRKAIAEHDPGLAASSARPTSRAASAPKARGNRRLGLRPCQPAKIR